MFANIGGSSLCAIDVGGSFGRDLSAQGEPAMIGVCEANGSPNCSAAKPRPPCRRPAATRWNTSPFRDGRDVGGLARRPALAQDPRPSPSAISSSLAKPRTRRSGGRSTAPGTAASARPIPRSAQDRRVEGRACRGADAVDEEAAGRRGRRGELSSPRSPPSSRTKRCADPGPIRRSNSFAKTRQLTMSRSKDC